MTKPERERKWKFCWRKPKSPPPKKKYLLENSFLSCFCLHKDENQRIFAYLKILYPDHMAGNIFSFDDNYYWWQIAIFPTIVDNLATFFTTDDSWQYFYTKWWQFDNNFYEWWQFDNMFYHIPLAQRKMNILHYCRYEWRCFYFDRAQDWNKTKLFCVRMKKRLISISVVKNENKFWPTDERTDTRANTCGLKIDLIS